MQESLFNLQNVKCAGCVGKIQKKLSSMAGVSVAQVNLLDKTLLVKYTGEKLDAQIIDAVSSIGFGASLDQIVEEKTNLFKNVVLPLVLGIIAMYVVMADSLMPDLQTQRGFIFGFFLSIISAAVILYSGIKVYKNGLLGFKTLNFNMHSLIVMGVSSAWLYSFAIIILARFSNYAVMPHLYFDSSLMIIGLVNLGAVLEERAKSSTTNAVKSLVHLVPEMTTVVVDGTDEVIASNLLRTEHLVRIRPGEKIPADGEIISGDGYVNESMLTGEPIAIYKKIDDFVSAGTINTSGSFVFRVTKIGGDTFLAKIISLIKNAQLNKPPLAKLADDVAKIFVPTIMLIALVSGVVWYYISSEYSFYYAMSVFMTILLIACPCSVGLAIPVSLMVGVGRGAKDGILIRDPSCLGVGDKVNIVVLDKTGTITTGTPQVVNSVVADGVDKIAIWKLIQASQQNSEHPLAKALMTYCQTNADLPQISDFKSIAGSGITVYSDGIQYYIGSRAWMDELGVGNSSLVTENIYTQVYVAALDAVLARFDLADTIKEDAKETIVKLQQSGMQVIMLTGDNQASASYVATLVGIDKIYANCKPDDKINVIKELRHAGNKVVFVGDGINDAPSLVASDIGIAIGGGTDIAKQSAAISLMRDSLMGVYESLILARAINRNMRQNLFGSFAYNAVAVLVAAGVFYPLWHVMLDPMFASIIMSVSSLTVIANALLLRNVNFR